MTNSADPEQLASSEANWSEATLVAKTGHVVFSQRWVKIYSEQFDFPTGVNNSFLWDI